MRSGEGFGTHSGLCVMLIVAMHQVNDSAGNVVEVEYGWEGVQAGGVKLVAVFHGEFGECRKVSFLNRPDHVVHTSRDHMVRTVLRYTGGKFPKISVSIATQELS